MLTLTEIYERYSLPDQGGDKGTLHSYIEIYGREIDRRKKVSLLEVGVWEGHSLAMWEEYLTESTVIGLDVNVERCVFPVDARLCDATDANGVDNVLGDMTFDYIIDDGSHRVGDQVDTLGLLWERVKPGGKYFIEDIAGDDALDKVVEAANSCHALHVVYDLRGKKNRFDDILVMIARDA